jgi:Tfp pilus assembly protein PilF
MKPTRCSNRPLRRAARCHPLLWPLLALAAAGCANTPTGALPEQPTARSVSDAAVEAPLRHDWLQAAAAALRQGQTRQAQEWLQAGLVRHPRHAQAHLLLAVSHHMDGDDSALDLAQTGYGLARRFAADVFWPPFLAGIAALERQQSGEALALLAEAVAADPNQALGFEALAAAAYLQGEFGLARAAAEQALRLDPRGGHAARSALMASAAIGDRAEVQRRLDAPEANWPAELRLRSAQLLRTSTVAETAPERAPGLPPNPEQVSVDVVLILSDGRSSEGLGINLLDGLRISYGAERISNNTPGTAASITRALRIPDISYSLNIANRSARRYQMVARPSLTAFNGQPSSFFVGEQLVVQTAGVNVAQLERIDVGVKLTVTPSQVREDGAQFRIEADRSFFSDVPGGSFREQLSIFKQSVAATADVRYGETLVLSGLQEQVSDQQSSKVPGLGDVPGPNLLFNHSNQLNRQRSVLVLVTPSQPLGFARAAAAGTAARAAAVQQLIELWDQIVEPATGVTRGAELLRRRFSGRRVAAADVLWPALRDGALLQAVLAHVERTLPPAQAPRANDTRPMLQPVVKDVRS